jgi:hypothetical protein
MARRAPPYRQAAPIGGIAGAAFIIVRCEGEGRHQQRDGQSDQCRFEVPHGLKIWVLAHIFDNH